MERLEQEYAQVYAELKVNKAKLDQLKLEILQKMEADDILKKDTPYGKFTRTARKVYSYSPAVAALQERLDVAKVKEQHSGKAEVREVPYLLYKMSK